MKRWLVVLGLLLPGIAIATIGTADERKAVSGDYYAPNGAINSAVERQAAAGDYLPSDPAAVLGPRGGTHSLLGVGR